jgi:hypothetical protein
VGKQGRGGGCYIGVRTEWVAARGHRGQRAHPSPWKHAAPYKSMQSPRTRATQATIRGTKGERAPSCLSVGRSTLGSHACNIVGASGALHCTATPAATSSPNADNTEIPGRTHPPNTLAHWRPHPTPTRSTLTPPALRQRLASEQQRPSQHTLARGCNAGNSCICTLLSTGRATPRTEGQD